MTTPGTDVPERSEAVRDGEHFLRLAHEFYRAGVTPIPLQGGEYAKTPLSFSNRVRCGFKKEELNRLYDDGWGASPLTWERFDEMFLLAGGIGIACGGCSGGLAVLDFDDARAEKRWRHTHPALAGSMPRVKTLRGVHYYFMLSGEEFYNGDFYVEGCRPKAGQLKLSRSYVVAPPSHHPCGMRYKWLGQSILERRPPELRVAALEVKLCARATDAAALSDPRRQIGTIGSRPTPTLNGNTAPLGGVTPPSVHGVLPRGVALVRRHLPKEAGCRNKRLLQLVRACKSVPELAPLPLEEFRPLVRLWCKELKKLTFVRGTSFQQNWSEFSSAWQNCNSSSSDNLDRILQGLGLEGLSTIDKIRSICVELQLLNEDRPFILGSISLSLRLGVSQTRAYQLLQKLVRRGEIELVERGQRKSQTANTYRLGPRFRIVE